ncbi:low molecular weight phosphotyrosine protein phosphatase [Paraburkholderia nemoris]|uniref:low molecular weight protein-tyrosine-phosphatase n=1 Tax=Paraburkholderia nemoris TaxID=2793076 RepID=UPI0038BDBE63
MFNRILIVCTGNICRSPMAEGLLKRECSTRFISSAGLHVIEGLAADPLAIETMAEFGIDISQHVARRLRHKDAVSADLIMVMETEQKREIERVFPEVRGKVFRFAEPNGVDVLDPYRKSKPFFSATLKLLAENAASWTTKLEPSNTRT